MQQHNKLVAEQRGNRDHDIHHRKENECDLIDLKH